MHSETSTSYYSCKQCYKKAKNRKTYETPKSENETNLCAKIKIYKGLGINIRIRKDVNIGFRDLLKEVIKRKT